MRGAGLVIAAALALAGSQADAMTSAKKLILLGSGGGPAVPLGAIRSVAILSNGWEAQVQLSKMACAGAFAAYSLTPDATAKGVLSVTSPGYTTTGSATTIGRTVDFTVPVRKPYSSNTVPAEVPNSKGCIITLALADFVNVGDTATLSLASGAYTSGSANLVQTNVAVRNSSGHAHEVPIGNWITPPHLSVTPSQTFTVEVVVGHKRPRSGKQVQAVVFDANDGTHHATCTTSSMSQLNSLVSTGNPIYGYSCTFAAGAFAALNSGEDQVDFSAYPIVGNNALVASQGQDGVPIAKTVRTLNLKPLSFVNDASSNYVPAYGWVQSGGTCTGATCISSNSTDPGTTNSLNYGSIYNCLAGVQAFNNANRSHNDMADAQCYVRAGTWNGFDASNSPNALNVGLSWAKVIAAPGHGTTDVIYQRAATSTGTNGVADRMWFENIAFSEVDTTSSAYNIELLGGDNGPAPFNYEMVCNLCKWTITAPGWPMLWQVGVVRWINSNLVTNNNDGSLVTAFGGQGYMPEWLGGAISGTSLQMYVPTVMIGTQLQGMKQVYNPAQQTNYPTPTGLIQAFVTQYNSPVPLDFNTPTNPPAGNVLFLQDLYEKTTVDAGVSMRILGDGDETPISNVVVQYTTWVGGRLNFLYNDGQGPSGAAKSTPKEGSILYSVWGPMTSQGYNIKADVFNGGNPPNGARTGNWPTEFGVGYIGDVVLQSAQGDTAPNVNGTSWLGMYFGSTGSTTANNFGYNQTIGFTADNSAGGTNTGNGTYTITGAGASPAFGRVPSGLAGLPNDIAGTARLNNGNGCGGAFESC